MGDHYREQVTFILDGNEVEVRAVKDHDGAEVLRIRNLGKLDTTRLRILPDVSNTILVGVSE